MKASRVARSLRGYIAHEDASTRACNIIAAVIVANQPFYPLYVAWALGRAEPWAFLTLLSTPVFSVVPLVSRLNSGLGRLLLVLAGMANTVLAVRIFGIASGVLVFLMPCLLIASALFRAEERWLSIGVFIVALGLYLGFPDGYGAPLCGCSPSEASALAPLHAISASCLVILIGWIVRSLGKGTSAETEADC